MVLGTFLKYMKNVIGPSIDFEHCVLLCPSVSRFYNFSLLNLFLLGASCYEGMIWIAVHLHVKSPQKLNFDSNVV
jgi:hypothetical protein